MIPRVTEQMPCSSGGTESKCHVLPVAETSGGVVVTLFPAWSFARLMWSSVDVLRQSFAPLNGGHWQLRVISSSFPLLPLQTVLFIIFDIAHPLVLPALVVGCRRQN